MQTDTNFTTGAGQYGATGNNQGGMGMGTGMGGMGGNTTGQTGNGDMLDKGVDYAERRAGHEQSHSTTEKISDAIRTGVKKVTGKDVPIKDKQYT